VIAETLFNVINLNPPESLMTDPVPISSSEAPDTRIAVGAALDALDEGTRAQTAAAAHGNYRALAGAALQLVDRLGHQPASGRAEWVPKCDRAAVRIYSLHIGFQGFRPVQDHRRERLVDPISP
jgi:hypothetical protein